ncbi:MAG: biosynthetic-type acetolactate synthase large subunit [Firmicutes bacterium]|nr:biosynthetic-type acetolactate synthase large subunit [Bacillota bacterium]
MKLKGAQILLECLKEQGVNTLFGYPGGAVIPLYDALYDEMDNFNHFKTAHEQGALHAADGYARTTGKVGVCFATSGPGATNTITGIATAYMDSVPLVVITGQVPSGLLGKDSFQEIDITGVTLPITKHNYLIQDINELAETVRKAFVIAKSGRPGPVLIDVPKDIFLKETEYFKKDIVAPKKEQKLNLDLLKRVADKINKARKPVIYAGGGIITSNANKELYNFSTKADIPVANTLMGLGCFPRDNKLSLGLVGMHGARETNLAVTESDLIIAIGARFSDRVIGKADKFAPRANIIHIDIDSTEIDKNLGTDISVIGDVKTILIKLVEYLDKNKRNEWLKKISNWKLEYDEEISFSPCEILKTLNNYLGEDTLVSTDVGQHQMWVAQNWEFNKPRSFISSGGLGTMGFGLGASIGAQIGNPNNKSLLITGDGSFRMNLNELSTVKSYNLPVIIVLFNNRTLGMVRQWQRMFSNERYSETDLGNEVDFVKLVNAYGINGYKVNNLESFKKILADKTNDNEPIFIECIIDKDESVYPIVPPGKPINKLIINE